MQIAYSEHDLQDILRLYATGFKVAKGDKIVKTEHFLDITQGKVLFRVYVLQAGEDEAKPLIVLPNDKN